MNIRNKKVRINNALQKTKEIGSIINNLRSRMDSVSDIDMSKIDAMLPASIDEMRYLNMITSLAKKSYVSISDLKMISSKDNKNIEPVSSYKNNITRNKKISDVSIQFSISAPYGLFKKFLKEIEKSLVLLNVNSISLDPKKANTSTLVSTDTYDYKVSLTTYLKK